MSAAAAMEVNAEARRILAVSISKLYASRSQRGGLRLHRSLLLSLVMRSARDIYHSSRESDGPSGGASTEEAMETEPQPEPQPQPEPEPQPELQPAEEPGRQAEEQQEEEEETTEDKENMSPTKQSRKRRGKASAAPDFLPSKRARLEPGEERHAAAGSCCRAAGAAESLTALSLNRVIPAC